MNRWKIGFFLLAGLLAASILYVLLLISSPGESEAIPERKDIVQGNTLMVSATKQDVEGIANTYIRKAIKGDKLPVVLYVKDHIILASELTIFGFTLPVTMNFEPVVREDGNLILKQSSVEVGELNIPPSTVLSLLEDTVDLPAWMIVRPHEEELFIDLSALPVSGDIKVKAKKFNLDQDEILFEVTIPN